jgi:hypothetical protein
LKQKRQRMEGENIINERTGRQYYKTNQGVEKNSKNSKFKNAKIQKNSKFKKFKIQNSKIQKKKRSQPRQRIHESADPQLCGSGRRARQQPACQPPPIIYTQPGLGPDKHGLREPSRDARRKLCVRMEVLRRNPRGEDNKQRAERGGRVRGARKLGGERRGAEHRGAPVDGRRGEGRDGRHGNGRLAFRRRSAVGEPQHTGQHAAGGAEVSGFAGNVTQGVKGTGGRLGQQ